jgi:hypothetical protein
MHGKVELSLDAAQHAEQGKQQRFLQMERQAAEFTQ